MDRLDTRKKTYIPLYFFVLGVLLRYFIGCYLKTPTFYWDELRYYGIARSIFNGHGIMIRNTTTSFQKILYSVVLSPLFAVRDVELRIRLIALLNSVLMNSCVFPLWIICSKIGIEKPKKILLAAFLIIWPDMLMTETFMSENLYWPLFFWYIVLHFYWRKNNYLLRGLAEGALIYCGYLCKEVFGAVFAADAICLFLESRQYRSEKKTYQYEWRRLLCAAAVFAVLFSLGKLLLFSGFGRSYNQTDLSALSKGNSPFYLFYAIIYLLVSTVLSVQLLPVVIPILRFRQMDREQRSLFLYLCVFIVFMICVIAYTISIREDLGNLVPRIHIRYYAPAVFMLLPVFVACPKCSDTVSREKDFTVLFIFSIAVLALFRSSSTYDIDHTTLQWVSGFSSLLSNAFKKDSVFFWIFHVMEIILVLGFSIWIYMFFSKRKKDFVLPFFVFLLIPVLCSNIFGHIKIKENYTLGLAPFESVARLSDHFAKTDDNVLYLAKTYSEARYKSRAWDCRYEPVERSFYFLYLGRFETEDDSTALIVNDAGSYAPDSKVSDFEFSDYIDHGHFSSTDRIDYVVIAGESGLTPKNDIFFEYVPSLSDSYYAVYRNKDPETLNINNFIISKANSHENGEQ